jgi:hypothetical protein
MKEAVERRDPLDVGQRQTQFSSQPGKHLARQPSVPCLSFAQDLHERMRLAAVAHENRTKSLSIK